MPEYYVGLMSGTSMDGIDAALVDFSGDSPALISTHNQPWPSHILSKLHASQKLDNNEIRELDALDTTLGEHFADATNQLLQHAGIETSDILAIGSHGQTVRHCPDAKHPFSLQLGKAEVITKQTGIHVISDFRTADIKAGGQGAPLVPAFHQAVFQNTELNRVIVNIGGIANITVLPKDPAQSVTGFDTGPGNTLMNAWMMKTLQQAYDKDGTLAASGTTDATLLATLLTDKYFALTPPKSTGFELFNLGWLDQHIKHDMEIADIQSTLCDLTATSIIRAINQYATDMDEIFICGGGAHNTELMGRIQNLTKCPVKTTRHLGIDPDWVEAMAFAWLARRTLNGQTGNLPSVTGARENVVLGSINYV
jgi:anhydro-N-acetylmuramic acid kinase